MTHLVQEWKGKTKRIEGKCSFSFLIGGLENKHIPTQYPKLNGNLYHKYKAISVWGFLLLSILIIALRPSALVVIVVAMTVQCILAQSATAKKRK